MQKRRWRDSVLYISINVDDILFCAWQIRRCFLSWFTKPTWFCSFFARQICFRFVSISTQSLRISLSFARQLHATNRNNEDISRKFDNIRKLQKLKKISDTHIKENLIRNSIVHHPELGKLQFEETLIRKTAIFN